MNKIIKSFAIALSVCLIFALTACSEKYIKPTIQIDNAHALRTTIDFDFTIFDEDDMLVDLKVVLTGEHNGVEYTDYKTISISGGDYEEDDDTGEEVFIGETKENTFTGLITGNTYEITMTGTYDEKSRNMLEEKSISLTTSSVGSEDEPHEILNFEDLNNVRLDTDGYFILMDDINCADDDGNSQELKPFFTSSKDFTGNFDGNNKIISNFYQDSYDQDLGLFGYIGKNGKVYDLEINNSSINSIRYTNSRIGGFAGTNYGTLENITMNKIEISSKGPDDGTQYVGGFVGNNMGTIVNVDISNVQLNLNAPNSVRVGGFVGTNGTTSEDEDNLNQGEQSAASISNASVDVAELLIQIPSAPSYSSSDEDVDLFLNVGGFAGDNRGNIDNSDTNAEIGIYVEGTKTADLLTNEDYDGTKDYADYEQVNRHSAITSMELRVGGFVGINFVGTIKNCSTTTSVINIEVPFLDKIVFGAFAGRNDVLGTINGCSYASNSSITYLLVLSEDTIVHDGNKSMVGYAVGINNNLDLNSSSITTTSTGALAQFDYYVRTSTKNPDYNQEETNTVEEDEKPVIPEYLYEFEKKNLDINNLLV